MPQLQQTGQHQNVYIYTINSSNTLINPFTTICTINNNVPYFTLSEFQRQPDFKPCTMCSEIKDNPTDECA